MKSFLSQRYKDVLYNRFDIVLADKFTKFDRDFNVLIDKLQKIEQPILPNQRILIEHFDTDYYNPAILKNGLNIYNLIECFRTVDISMGVVVLVTNNFGITEEISAMTNHETESMPTVIETFITNLTINANGYENYNIDADRVEKNAICMMGGVPRSHRIAMYNSITDNNLLNKIAVSS